MEDSEELLYKMELGLGSSVIGVRTQEMENSKENHGASHASEHVVLINKSELKNPLAWSSIA